MDIVSSDILSTISITHCSCYLYTGLPSWEVNLVCIMLFVGLYNIAFIILRYHLKIPDCTRLAFDQIKWIRKLRDLELSGTLYNQI